MRFLLSLFLLSRFRTYWATCHLHCTGFSLCSTSNISTFAGLGFCCAWLPPHRGWGEVVSARLNLSHGTIYVGGVCNFLGSVSPQQKFEVLQLRVTAPCYSSVLFRKWRKIHPWYMRVGRPKRGEKKRSPQGLFLNNEKTQEIRKIYMIIDLNDCIIKCKIGISIFN